MFGKIGNMLDSAVDLATDNVKGLIKDPSKALVNPFKDTIDVIDGLTQGELRTRAITRLGVDAVTGMSISELIDDYKVHGKD